MKKIKLTKPKGAVAGAGFPIQLLNSADEHCSSNFFYYVKY